MGNDGQLWGPDDLKIENPGRIIFVGLVIVAALALLAGARQTYFTVAPEEQGLVLRFGKTHRTVGPGLHFKAPFGIEDVRRVPVQRTLKAEFGFRTLKAGVHSEYAKQGYEDESLMLTGDLNSADVLWVVQYRVTDANKYLFKVRSVDQTFRDVTEATMSEIIGDRSVDEVITWGKDEINSKVLKRLQLRCDEYETGLTVKMVLLQDVNVPAPVQPSWNEVNEAEQEKDKLLNQAKSRYNAEVPRAKGEADRTIKKAEGYAIERINQAKGESAKFMSVYNEYVKAPEVTRRRIYLETMAHVLPRSGRKIIMDQEGDGVLRFLDLSGKEAKP